MFSVKWKLSRHTGVQVSITKWHMGEGGLKYAKKVSRIIWMAPYSFSDSRVCAWLFMAVFLNWWAAKSFREHIKTILFLSFQSYCTFRCAANFFSQRVCPKLKMLIKALQKAEYFRKIQNRFFSVLRVFCIASKSYFQNTKHMTKQTKLNFFRPKNGALGPKNRVTVFKNVRF